VFFDSTAPRSEVTAPLLAIYGRRPSLKDLQQAHLRFRGIRQRAVVNAKQLVGNQCLFWLVDTAASGLLPQTKREQRVSSSYRDVLLAAH
jgi:hypothetical protein